MISRNLTPITEDVTICGYICQWSGSGLEKYGKEMLVNKDIFYFVSDLMFHNFVDFSILVQFYFFIFIYKKIWDPSQLNLTI